MIPLEWCLAALAFRRGESNIFIFRYAVYNYVEKRTYENAKDKDKTYSKEFHYLSPPKRRVRFS